MNRIKQIAIGYILLAALSVCAYAQAAKVDRYASGRPTAKELLDKYGETQNTIKSYIIKTEVAIDDEALFTRSNKHLSGKTKTNKLVEFRTDGHRAFRSELAWGDVNKAIPSLMGLPKEKAVYRSWLWDGRQHLTNCYSYKSTATDYSKDRVTICMGSGARDAGGRMACNGELVDYIGNERIDAFLLKALQRGDKISVRKEKKRIGESDCYVIEATIKDGGKRKLWIDPDHGYNISKSTYRQVGGMREGHRQPDRLIMYASREVVRFEKIDNVWIPMELHYKGGRRASFDDYFNRKILTKVIKVTLNPDHDALGSFAPKDVRKGAEVGIHGVDGIDFRTEYTWQNGAVVDANGNKVDLKKIGNETKKGGNQF